MGNNTPFSVVGTPIGNLGDISKRALEALDNADVIFAEDTRTALNLLNHLGLKKKVVSCHKDNERTAANKILSELNSGGKAALISEAGMPCISDPGSAVVKTLIENNIPFEVVSGPTALIHGIISSGFSGGPFHFYGFLPHKGPEKKTAMEGLKNIPSPIIFYESPHRVKETLKMLLEAFPPPVACCRELTKLHEETVFINKPDDIENLTIKGEFVLAVDNSSAAAKEKTAGFDPAEVCKKLSKEGFSSQEIVKVLKALGVKRNEAYKTVMEENS